MVAAPLLTSLAAATDIVHALAMLLWALGLPLLFYRRWPRVSGAYAWYAVAFVLVSQVSHYWLGECILTLVSRWLRTEGGMASAEDVLFTVRIVNFVAGVRPSTRVAVLLWEIAIATTGVALLWHAYASGVTARRHRVR